MKAYRIGERSNSQRLWEYLTEHGRILLPMIVAVHGSGESRREPVMGEVDERSIVRGNGLESAR